jgi:hypothetical protein
MKETAVLAGPSRPLGALEIPQFHLPGGGSAGTYAPRLYGAARVQFADRRRKIDETRRVAFLVPLDPATRTVDWDAARATTVMPDGLLKEPPIAAKYLPLPSGAMTVKVFTRWAKAFDRWLARTQRLDVPAKPDANPPEPSSLAPKRGGVSVELVAIVWEVN